MSTEERILTKYLVTPAPLPSIISLQDFILLFPKAHQSSPHIRTLYHDLQEQRASLLATVAANISTEVAEGKDLRRAVAKQRRALEKEEGDDEIAVEQALAGANGDNRTLHTAETLLPAMESAVEAMEAEIRELEKLQASLLESARMSIGSLSDLRYGKLANSDLPEEVMDSLKAVEETCKNK